MQEPTSPREPDEPFEAYCARVRAANERLRLKRTGITRNRTPSHDSLWGALTSQPKWEPTQ